LRESQQRYRGDTMLLETEFVCDGGRVRITDLMPVDTSCTLIRIIEGVEGEVALEMILDVRFGYGADAPWITVEDDGVHFIAGPNSLVLRAPFSITRTGKRISAVVNVKKGQRFALELTWHPSQEASPSPLDVDGETAKTEAFWREWAGRCTLKGEMRELVMRS